MKINFNLIKAFIKVNGSFYFMLFYFVPQNNNLVKLK